MWYPISITWKMFEIFHIDDRKEGVFMARKKKIQNITEGWTSYVYLRQAEVPVYPLLWRYRPSVEAVRAKMPKKKRNAARTDHSVEYDHIAYRFLELPTKAQAEQLRRTIGCARFLWNRMLGDRLDLYLPVMWPCHGQGSSGSGQSQGGSLTDHQREYCPDQTDSCIK